MSTELIFSPSDFVAVLNQTLDYAYPSTTLVGELANFRVSKNRWVYFDLKDEHASVKFFGIVHHLSHHIEDGMMLQVVGQPRLHPLYGFSVQVRSLHPVGQGSIKKSADVLMQKLKKEGLFDISKKRDLPFPPRKIGLIASGESAAFHDFMKILTQRWGGLEIHHADVQVQGERAEGDILRALDMFQADYQVDVVVLTRGGGSPEDLATFSSERVTRAVAASATPTLVAVGHEVDVSLAELAADVRASTPSNAAELLVPDRRDEQQQLAVQHQRLDSYAQTFVQRLRETLADQKATLHRTIADGISSERQIFVQTCKLLELLHPHSVLNRGYVILRDASGAVIRSGKVLKKGQTVSIKLHDAEADASIDTVGLQ
jgi:exodeoxyribonuclease VII large subunit